MHVLLEKVCFTKRGYIHGLLNLCLVLLVVVFAAGPWIGADAQQVNVTLFTESQCPFCTRLLREQVWQFHTTRPGIINLQIVPFGKGNCEYTPDRRLLCKCMHGPTECDLNRLQNCAISMECAKTQTGEVLNYYSMLNTHRAGIRIWPTAYVNGQFFDRSYPLETEICRHTNYC